MPAVPGNAGGLHGRTVRDHSVRCGTARDLPRPDHQHKASDQSRSRDH